MIDKPFIYCWFYGPYLYKKYGFKALLWNIENWFKNLRHACRWLKWCWQRAFRGWADCDWWDMHSYLVGIIIPMLKEFKAKTISYPGYGKASTPEKWDALLDEMIEAFEAADRVISDEYYKEVSGDSVEAIEGATKAEVNQWIALQKADVKLFEKKIKTFEKWFFHLWD